MEPIQHHFTVEDDEQGLRLDKFIAKHLPDESRTYIQTLITNGAVQCSHTEGSIDNCSSRVKPGESYHISIEPKPPLELIPANIPIDIIYEDEYLLVINKPVGLTVHPGAGNHQDTLVNALLYHYQDQLSSIGGFDRPGIVHRLDKDTSGLMLVAKNDKTHRILSEMIAQRLVKRHYLAYCWGRIIPPSGTIDQPIGRHPSNRQKMSVASGGKSAITHYQTKKIFGQNLASLVQCRLETGRTHQIRVHLSHVNHPIIGDQSYKSRHQNRQVVGLTDELTEFLNNFSHQALHSYFLALEHPITGNYMELEGAQPDNMIKLNKLLSMLD